MEIHTLENRPKIIAKPEILIKRITRKDVKANNSRVSPVFADMVEEAGQEVYDYLTRYGITSKDRVLFLSNTRHYLYDSDDLKEVESIVNFRLINRTTHIWYYLHTMNRILSVDGYFAGCFLDYKNQRETLVGNNHSLLGRLFLFMYRFVNRIVPRVPFINNVQFVLNHGRIKCITGTEMKGLLEKNGFQLIDMVEIDRLTYFIARKSGEDSQKTMSVLNLLTHFKTKSRVINI